MLREMAERFKFLAQRIRQSDRFLRTMLIHRTRAAVRVAEDRRDHRNIAISRLKARRSPNVPAVADRKPQCSRATGVAQERPNQKCARRKVGDVEIG